MMVDAAIEDILDKLGRKAKLLQSESIKEVEAASAGFLSAKTKLTAVAAFGRGDRHLGDQLRENSDSPVGVQPLRAVSTPPAPEVAAGEVQVDVAQLTDHDVDHDMAQLDQHFSQEPSLAALANAPTPVIDSTTAAPAGPAIPHLTLWNAARGRLWRAEQARRREAKFEVRGMVTKAETTKAVSSLRSPELADRDERARVEAWLEAERDRAETETTQIMAEGEQATSASVIQSGGQTRSLSYMRCASSAGRVALCRARAANDLQI